MSNPPRHLLILIAALFLGGVVTSCAPPKVKVLKRFPQYGYSVSGQPGWQVGEYERAGLVWFESSLGGDQAQGGALVLIYGANCNGLTAESAGDTLDREVALLADLYSLESIDIVGEPLAVDHDGRTVTSLVMEIPISAISEDSLTNQMGIPPISPTQEVEIIDIRDSWGGHAIVHIHRGPSDHLNKQAREIAESVQPQCK